MGIFRRDVFSFWQPLDKKFMQVILGLSEQQKVELVSFFWSGLMFSYLDYNEELEKLPYQLLTQRQNRIVFQNMRDATLSPTGQFFVAVARSADTLSPSAGRGVQGTK